MAAGRRWRPALDQRRVGWWGGQVQVVGRVWTHLAAPRRLPVGEGDLLQVDGRLHGLEQDVPLFGVKLKVPFAGVAPAPGLEGEGGLRRGTDQSPFTFLLI